MFICIAQAKSVVTSLNVIYQLDYHYLSTSQNSFHLSFTYCQIVVSYETELFDWLKLKYSIIIALAL